MFNFIKNIIFPVRCVGCKEFGIEMCQRCMQYLWPYTGFGKHKHVIPAFSYRDKKLRKVIYLTKKYHLPKLSRQLGEVMGEKLREEIYELLDLNGISEVVITFVPTSRKRKRKRGYNPAQELAIGFRDEIFAESPICNTLAVQKGNKKQSTLRTDPERYENIQGVFSVQPSDVPRGKTIIVCDDVTTSGATMKEAMRVLRQLDPALIIGVTLAG